MTRTIEIRFLAQPNLNDSFQYLIKLNGAPISYSGGIPTVNHRFETYDGYPIYIKIGASLNETISRTKERLNAVSNNANITYTSSATSVLVHVTFDGTITVENATATGNIRIDTGDGELVMQEPVDNGQLYKAYNNHIVKMYSTGASPAYALVTTDAFEARLYPDPQGRFYFNFRPYVSSLINTRNFADTLNPVISGANANSFVYNFMEGSYFEKNVTFRIVRENGGTDEAQVNLAWFPGVEQPGDHHRFSRTESYVLTPFPRNTTTHFYLKYWEGYPFDFALYYPNTTLYLRNSTTGFTQPFAIPSLMSRVLLSDGRTNVSLESVLPLASGYNSLRLMASAMPSVKDKFLTLQKMPYQCGVYLKWLNRYGGYSYWLFENTYTVDRSVKSLGEMDDDNTNLKDMYGRTLQLGRESQDTVRIVAELLEENDRRIVEGLLESPKIYLFTGQPYARNGIQEWIEVSLKTSSARLKNARERLTNFTFDLELPQRYTQTL